MQCAQIPTDLSFCIPPLVVGCTYLSPFLHLPRVPRLALLHHRPQPEGGGRQQRRRQQSQKEQPSLLQRKKKKKKKRNGTVDLRYGELQHSFVTVHVPNYQFCFFYIGINNLVHPYENIFFLPLRS